MIPYGRQNISQEDIDSVVEVLRSDFITQGPVVPLFEKTVAEYCGAKHAVAVNSATSALHIACISLGLGPGDLVWTSPITFVASANCARYCGADVDFVDIDPQTHNMSTSALAEKLEQAKSINRLPKVVIPVHFAGQSCDMSSIYQLSKEYGFRIIEDASHAIGGSYRDEKVGSCLYSDITVFSFHPVKIVTTGEGGMAMTNDAEIANHMTRLRSHGITRYPSEMNRAPVGSWFYQQIELGFNYRMTEMQAALGVSQLHRIDDFVSQRHQIADRYSELLQYTPIILPGKFPDAYSALHLYVVRIAGDKFSSSRREVFERMRADGIGVNLHYIPVYQQPYYEVMGYKGEEFPHSEKYYSEAISLPIFPGLSLHQQDRVVESLLKSLCY